MAPDISIRNTCFLFAILLVLVACGGGGGSGDTTAPTAIVTTNAPAAPDPALVPDNTVITITFSESMNTTVGSWSLSGDLAGESNGGVWSMTTVQNDTLTISPASTWYARPGRNLIVNARDLSGNPAATLNLTYDVYTGILYYVDISQPDDLGDGMSPLTARKYIHTAVADAVPSATVLVAGGNYPVNLSPADTRIYLREAVSLYGGYSSDFTDRDPVLYPTTITDQSNFAASALNPNFALMADGTTIAITAATVVDGFTITGSTQAASAYTSAIRTRNSAAPMIYNNTINGGGGTSESYGIFVDTTSPRIMNNTIHGGSGTNSAGIYINGSAPTIQNNNIYGGNAGTYSYGVFNYEGADAVIQNNMIHGGNGITNSIGIGNINSSPIIQNNTIHGGIRPSAMGIFSSGGIPNPANPYIDNNIILTGATGTCINGAGVDSLPSSLRNNDVSGCLVVFADVSAPICLLNADGDGNDYTCALSEMNVLTGIPGGVGANISLDPMFADIDGVDNNLNTMADNDWHFSLGSSAFVTAGGLNGIDEGWTFTTDKDDITRPTSGSPWSMGAYEP